MLPGVAWGRLKLLNLDVFRGIQSYKDCTTAGVFFRGRTGQVNALISAIYDAAKLGRMGFPFPVTILLDSRVFRDPFCRLMIRKICSRAIAALVCSWAAAMALVVLVGSIFTYIERNTLGLGLIEVGGFIALALGVALGFCGVISVLLLTRGKASGARLMLLFSLFFIVSIGGSIIKDYVSGPWNWQAWFREENATVMIVAAFALSCLWTWPRAFRREVPRNTASARTPDAAPLTR